MHHHRPILLLLALVVLAAGEAPYGSKDFHPSPERPVGWRGDGSGAFPGAGAVPTQWDLAKGVNVIWRTAMPAWTTSSCIVVADLVVSKGEPDLVIACDRATGAVKWQCHVHPDAVPEEVYREAVPLLNRIATDLLEVGLDNGAERIPAGVDAKVIDRLFPAGGGKRRRDPYRLGLETPNYAHQGVNMATPVSDGQGIYAWMGNGVAARIDLAGRIVWKTVVAEKTLRGAQAAVSPVCVDGRFIVQVTARDRTVLVALDAATGRKVWERDGVHPSQWWSGSLVAVRAGDRALVVTGGGSVVDATSGERLFGRIGTHRDGGSPAALGDVVAFGTSDSRSYKKADGQSDEDFRQQKERHAQTLEPEKLPGGSRAVRLTAKDGKVVGEILYHLAEVKNTFNTPLLHPLGVAYYQDGGSLTVVDVRQGKVAQRVKSAAPRTRGDNAYNYACPFATGGLLFVDRHGPWKPQSVNTVEVHRIAPDGTLTQVAVNSLPRHVGMPFIQGDRIYVRTITELICLGPK